MSRSQPRRAAKRDGNEARIIQVLRNLGATVQQLDGAGVPDLLVGYDRNTYLLEVKNKGGALTPDQEAWHQSWHGQPVAVVRTFGDAAKAIGATPPDLAPAVPDRPLPVPPVRRGPGWRIYAEAAALALAAAQ